MENNKIESFDYAPYDIEIVTISDIKAMVAILQSPDSSTMWGFIKNIVRVVGIAACFFIMWRMRESAEAKHKQKSEINEINKAKNQIDSDNLD